jgi:hypothetical protein
MKPDNVIRDKSYHFALRMIKLYRYLVEEKNEYVLSKQVLRCGTSIGANVEEAIGGQSEKDFCQKCLSRTRKLVKPTIGSGFCGIAIIYPLR